MATNYVPKIPVKSPRKCSLIPFSLPCQTARSQEIRIFVENVNEALVLIKQQSER